MKCFVTGADGFIGSHLCEVLRDAGHEVTGLALYNSFDTFGWLDEVEGVRKVRGDVRDAGQMRKLVKGQEVVFHLAALISVPDSYERPESYIDTNVKGTLHVLNAAREAGVHLFIHTSTSEVYGTAAYSDMDETHPLRPQSPYAASKLSADFLVQSFHRSFGFPAVILRPFNAYGPRQSERAVIANIVRQAVDPRCDWVRLGALETSRDWTYVTDTASAFVALMTARFERGRLGLESGVLLGEVYNAATGKYWRVSEIATRVLARCGAKPIVDERERHRPVTSEVMHLCGASEKLRFATGWMPKVTIDEGLDLTIDWWRSRTPRKDLAYVA